MVAVTISSVIDAPVEQVWARIRDFNGLPGWHPRMVESHIEDGKGAETIGCVRNFQLASGARLREKLLDFSDQNFLVSYSILETPQPITNHKATLQLRRVTDGNRGEEPQRDRAVDPAPVSPSAGRCFRLLVGGVKLRFESGLIKGRPGIRGDAGLGIRCREAARQPVPTARPRTGRRRPCRRRCTS